MTTEEALLAAVWESPHDDLPRLAYADFLEERGDAARAEFIRVQCELARLDRWDDGREPLARRGLVLWAKHRTAWRRRLPNAVRSAGFVRGFPSPDFEHLTTTTFLRLPATAFAAAPLWAFEIDPPQRTPDKLLASPNLLRVGRLELRGWLRSAEAANRLASAAAARNLDDLLLQVPYSFNDGGLAALGTAAELASLRRLTLIGLGIDDDGLKALAASPLADRIEELTLVECLPVTPAGIAVLGESSRLSRLRRLRLRLFDSGMAAALATTRPAFRLAELQVFSVAAGEASALADWPGLASVRALDLGTEGGDLPALFGSQHLGQLRRLMVALDEPVGPDRDALEELARGTVLPGLVELHVRARIGAEVPPELFERLRARFGPGVTGS